MTLGGGEDVSQRKKILAEKLAKVLYAKYIHLVRRFPCYSCSISGKKNLQIPRYFKLAVLCVPPSWIRWRNTIIDSVYLSWHYYLFQCFLFSSGASKFNVSQREFDKKWTSYTKHSKVPGLCCEGGLWWFYPVCIPCTPCRISPPWTYENHYIVIVWIGVSLAYS